MNMIASEIPIFKSELFSSSFFCFSLHNTSDTIRSNTSSILVPSLAEVSIKFKLLAFAKLSP